MQRELRNSLFDVDRAIADFDAETEPANQAKPVAPAYDVDDVLMSLTPGLPREAGIRSPPSATSNPYWPEEMRKMRDELSSLQTEIRSEFGDLKKSVVDSLKAANEANHSQGRRIDEIQKGWQVRDEQLADWVERVLQRLGQFEERLAQTAVAERKVDDMVQRHQEMVRAFENRLVHFQRVMAQQELMIHQLRESLINVRRP